MAEYLLTAAAEADLKDSSDAFPLNLSLFLPGTAAAHGAHTAVTWAIHKRLEQIPVFIRYFAITQ